MALVDVTRVWQGQLGALNIRCTNSPGDTGVLDTRVHSAWTTEVLCSILQRKLQMSIWGLSSTQCGLVTGSPTLTLKYPLM